VSFGAVVKNESRVNIPFEVNPVFDLGDSQHDDETGSDDSDITKAVAQALEAYMSF
jgi:ABC-type hemin transport system ATPase subunit